MRYGIAFAGVAMLMLMVFNADIIGEVFGAVAGGAILPLVFALLMAGVVLSSVLFGALKHHQWMRNRINDDSDNDDTRVIESSRSVTICK